METMDDLHNYLLSTTYDITVILLAYTYTPNNKVIPNLLAAQHKKLKDNETYQLTYEYLVITSSQIYNFYLANVTTMIPYLVTYKKQYKLRDPWWFPCKQTDPAGPTEDVNRFILQSLKN
jgi:hypothetical protein